MGKARNIADLLDSSGNIANTKLAADSIDSAQIADGAVDNVHLATGITSSKLTGALPAIDGSALTGVATDTSTIENNIALLGFYRASDNSKAKYSLVDQVIDEYTDATGIDAGASTNETLTSGYYSGSSTSAGTPVQHLGGTGGASNSIPVSYTHLTLPTN